MIIGCFALIDPSIPLDHLFKAIKEMGFDHVDSGISTMEPLSEQSLILQ